MIFFCPFLALLISSGIAVPKFYNPTAVNPMKYAEQVIFSQASVFLAEAT